MDFQSLFQQFLNGDVAQQASTLHSLVIFLPELVLSSAIVLMLLARLTSFDRVIPTHWIALLGAMSSFLIVLYQFWQLSSDDQSAVTSFTYFTGLAVHDAFSIFFRGFLAFFLVFVIALTVISGIPDDEDAPDFYSLLTG